MEAGKGVEAAEYCISEQYAPERRSYFHGKLIPGLNNKIRKSQKYNKYKYNNWNNNDYI